MPKSQQTSILQTTLLYSLTNDDTKITLTNLTRYPSCKQDGTANSHINKFRLSSRRMIRKTALKVFLKRCLDFREKPFFMSGTNSNVVVMTKLHHTQLFYLQFLLNHLSMWILPHKCSCERIFNYCIRFESYLGHTCNVIVLFSNLKE